jgi:DNA-binding MarR family transcriptional regulator
MVSLIDQLEGDGLAERRRRPGDRRAWEVTITSKGRRMLERGKRLAKKVEDDVLGGLDGQEREQLVALLRRALVAAPPQPAWHTAEGD